MIFISTLLTIIISIKSRVYDPIETVKSKLLQKLNDMSIKFEIQPEKDYFFTFNSKNIIYDLSKFNISEIEDSIILVNQSIRLIFNLSINEKTDTFFDYYFDNIVYSELISIDIFFQKLKFYKAKPDYTFDLYYKTDYGSMKIFFENSKYVNSFKYLLYEDKDKLFENKTFYDFMKIKIFENFIKGIRKILIIYPECDSFYHFNKTITNCGNKPLKIDYYMENERRSYYRATINYFEYEDINKINDVIIYEKITTKITLIYFNDKGIGEEELEDFYEFHILKLDNITIDMDLNIEYGKLTEGDSYVLSIFKEILTTNYSLTNCL